MAAAWWTAAHGRPKRQMPMERFLGKFDKKNVTKVRDRDDLIQQMIVAVGGKWDGGDRTPG